LQRKMDRRRSGMNGIARGAFRRAQIEKEAAVFIGDA
jgi:hypothetical protein